MIRSIEIRGFRGIREGSLKDLTPLVVLVGPNGSGKSTVIEAMLVAASPLPSDALEHVVLRHQPGGSDPRWLLWKAGDNGPTEITVTTDKDTKRVCPLVLARDRPANDTFISYQTLDSAQLTGHGWVQAVDTKLRGKNSAGFRAVDDLREVHLVEAYASAPQRPLHDLYTKTARNGRKSEALEILRKVIPSVTDMEILTEGSAPILYLDYADSAVPVSLSGDGIQSLIRLTLELAASGSGLALLEEPEVHQHPAAMRQSARIILAAVRRGLQVVLTTHSLELIDSLLGESTPEDLPKLSVYRLLLQSGALKSSRLLGPEVAFARGQIEDDLR